MIKDNDTATKILADAEVVENAAAVGESDTQTLVSAMRNAGVETFGQLVNYCRTHRVTPGQLAAGGN